MSNNSSPASASAVISDPEVQRAVWFLGALLQVRASGAQTDGRFAVIEHSARRSYNSPMHIHHDDDETFLVLDGALRVLCGGQEYAAQAGTAALLPHGVEHGFVVISPDARILTLHHPAGFENFVIEVGAPAPELLLPPPLEGPPPPEAVEALATAAARYGMTIVGPPPST
jgi:quercetin dioxygenase-like cupin family protein